MAPWCLTSNLRRMDRMDQGRAGRFSHHFNGHAGQEPIEDGGTYHFFKAYFLGLCKEISPQNMALYGTVPWNSH